MENVKQLLGLRIRELRKTKKLTQEQLAEIAKIEIPSLSNIENGKNYPNSETIEKIAKGLCVEIFELYIFEHFIEPSKEKMLYEINFLLNNDDKLLKTIYKITTNLKKEHVNS